MTSHLKETSTKENNQIHLNISSHNDANTIWNKIPTDGLQASLFNSLHLEFGFVKTDLIAGFLAIVFKNILGISQFNSMLESFKRLNIELNFESGSYLKEFPKVQMIKEHPPAPEKSPVADFLLQSNIEKVKNEIFRVDSTSLIQL